MLKKCLIIRYGAYGDSLIITPLLRRLKKDGWHIILQTSERGMEILQDDPYVDELLLHKLNSVPSNQLSEYWDKLVKNINPDKVINLSESIEVDLALHPASVRYIWPKNQRAKFANVNYYEHTFVKSGIPITEDDDFRPHITLSKKECDFAKRTMANGKMNIVWGLSGSGKNRAWPWVDVVVNNLWASYDNIMVHFVGDEQCQILEYGLNNKKKCNLLSGKISMRQSIALCKYADLVICPDTGLLHGAGCFDVPKIGLLGNTTKMAITKHFVNDFSIEADKNLSECAPCSYLVYDNSVQCPIEPTSHASWCMYYGLNPIVVEEAIHEFIAKRTSLTRHIPSKIMS